MLFVNKADGRYAIFDEVTGAIEKEFPAYNNSNSAFYAGDLDGDGLSDLIFLSHPHIVPPFFRAYHWNGSDYVTFISHSDSVASFSGEAFRTAGQREIAEVSGVPDDPTGHPTCDFRLRDLSGNVLFRASTDVPGWSRPYRGHNWIDRNQDGVQELILEDQTTARMYNQYNGSFTVAWTLTGWSRLVELGNLDGDPQIGAPGDQQRRRPLRPRRRVDRCDPAGVPVIHINVGRPGRTERRRRQPPGAHRHRVRRRRPPCSRSTIGTAPALPRSSP